MKKETRFWVRRITFVILIVMVGFAIYLTLEQGKEKELQVGEQAPEIQLESLTGEQVKLSDLRGKYVLLNFWATWCDPCEAEMPDLERVSQQYKDEDVVVVGVNIAESKVTVASFARQHELTFPLWLDSKRIAMDDYHVGNLPASFFISPEGEIQRKYEGAMTEAQMQMWIHDMMAEDQKE
ncbi:thiol-disulfide oxidoreductase ResA [Mechercharimyces sp. CAU 1602]|uniref:thiol-disulfide oxidoreductase ResA n=1 Tax=Mechercharimyces sp. CAU 1602 TaxID=2973933 RepID=UPI0021631B1F|nr:thiol-disulfide oxidoreductase ResA [Mechercharimyces sp. CAU 1602]MCS1350599.1 thiol-disulfide oxidoreductase ResA [Mechercharimyces sp. CAU 1602]